MNSLPLPGPSLSAAMRAAVHLDELLDDRQPDAEPALGAGERAVPLGEELEHLGELLGRDADAPVPDADDDLVRPRCGPMSRMWPAVLAVLGRVVQQVHHHLLEPGRVGVDPEVAPVDARRRARASAPRRAASPWPTALSRIGVASSTSLRSSIFPRVMRETSSRSSMSRVRCFICRAMTSIDQSMCSFESAPGRHARRRCRWRPAGSSARGRAWPGTRPCAGRCPQFLVEPRVLDGDGGEPRELHEDGLVIVRELALVLSASWSSPMLLPLRPTSGAASQPFRSGSPVRPFPASSISGRYPGRPGSGEQALIPR